MNLALDRQVARWYPLVDHPVQLALNEAVGKGIRFPLVPSGRRSGKTERAKRYIARQAMRNPGEKYFAAAPTYNQAKKIWWDDLKALTLSSVHARRPSESNLIIYMPNGTEIHVIGLDQPQRFEGVPWTGGVIDEIASIKSEALNLNIMPALNTVNPARPHYRVWCWFIGVPEDLNHYFDMVEYAKSGVSQDWAVFTWHSADILPRDIIDAEKARMSAQQFRQEYEGSFETASGRIYEGYGQANVTTSALLPHEQIMWCHDFNFTPMSSAICARRGNDFYVLDEIVLTSATSRQSAMEFVDRYSGHGNKNLLIYGDPAGRAGEKHGHASDYTDIEDVLRAHGWKLTRKVKASAPAIKDRQNAVRAKIMAANGSISLYVNQAKAIYAHKGLLTCQLKKGSTFLEDDGEYQHITTAIGYCVDYEWPLRRHADPVELEIIPSANYFNRPRQ